MERVELDLVLEGRHDLSGQIYRRLRAVILDGRLRAGQALPPTRELAVRLTVSRNTVSVAYDRLAAEGFVAGRVGAGTFVNGQLAVRPPADPATADLPLRPRPVWDRLRVHADLSATEVEFDFRTGMPDARLFPYQTWRRLIANELRATAVRSGAYADPAGHPGLRAALARHVGVARAVQVEPANVLVTNGLQQAVDLVARVLLAPGDRVAMEEPGYPPPRMLFESLGARVDGVPVDGEGLVVEAIPDDARLVYVTPSHQYPLGVRMSLRRRLALLGWARERDAVVLEDDYDSDFRYAGPPIETLHSLDRDGRVVYAGTLSKVMLPTLRLGFCVPPPSLHAALTAAKFTTDWHTALPSQAALARFVDEGMLARHIRRMRSVYRERYDLISAALATDLARWVEPIPSAAGLHLAVLLRSGSVAEGCQIVRRARLLGVGLTALSSYAVGDAPVAGLALGFGLLPAERIPAGLARLRRCLREVCADPAASHAGDATS